MKVIVATFLLFSASLCAAAPGEAANVLPRHTIDVYTNLLRCPSWETARLGDSEVRREITRLYLGLSRFDTESVRAGVKKYVEDQSRDLLAEVDAWGKLYAFYRVFFRIEDRFYQTSSDEKPYPPEIQSFWGSPHRGSHEVSLLWPYTIGKDGALELLDVQGVEKGGPGYNPMVDFDQLLKRFGRRYPTSKE